MFPSLRNYLNNYGLVIFFSNIFEKNITTYSFIYKWPGYSSKIKLNIPLAVN